MSSVTVRLEGQEQLSRELRRRSRGELRAVARRVTTRALKPVLSLAKAAAPTRTGRLAASIGQLSTVNSRKTGYSSRVGIRRDFTFTERTSEEDQLLGNKGRKLVSGRGPLREKALAKGFVQDDRSAQLYAGGVHFGTDKKGRVKRKAGGAQFLERPIVQNTPSIIATVSAELRTFLESK